MRNSVGVVIRCFKIFMTKIYKLLKIGTTASLLRSSVNDYWVDLPPCSFPKYHLLSLYEILAKTITVVIGLPHNKNLEQWFWIGSAPYSRTVTETSKTDIERVSRHKHSEAQVSIQYFQYILNVTKAISSNGR